MMEAKDGDREPLTVLGPEHRAAVALALTNILNSDAALYTYAQVASGVPVLETDATYPQGDGWWRECNPNPEPSQEATEYVKDARAILDLKSISVDSVALRRFQDESLASSWFYRRLIEIIALACHDLAATLYHMTQGGLRKPILPRMEFPNFLPKSDYPPYNTLLFHPTYCDSEFYPRGSADVVGYWAECRIFGGVVLFGRGESGQESNGLFLNPLVEFNIFQVSKAQEQSLINALISKNGFPSSLRLPLRRKEGCYQVHPDLSVLEWIYRNQYDRMALGRTRPHCEPDVSQEVKDWWKEQYREFSRRRGE